MCHWYRQMQISFTNCYDSILACAHCRYSSMSILFGLVLHSTQNTNSELIRSIQRSKTIKSPHKLMARNGPSHLTPRRPTNVRRCHPYNPKGFFHTVPNHNRRKRRKLCWQTASPHRRKTPTKRIHQKCRFPTPAQNPSNPRYLRRTVQQNGKALRFICR